ncbi:MAG: hypothetical protein JSV78_04450 [Phycisphaerales bacterium]|nr:MAG: hypothetical protein JSV78_04450 [Phycisphaerales bacterium]
MKRSILKSVAMLAMGLAFVFACSVATPGCSEKRMCTCTVCQAKCSEKCSKKCAAGACPKKQAGKCHKKQAAHKCPKAKEAEPAEGEQK